MGSELTLIQRDPEVLDNVHLAEGKEVPADEQVFLAVNGRQYKLDLTTENAEKLKADVQPWVDVADEVEAPKATATRRSGGGGSRSTKRPERELTAKIREWAASQGIKLNEKGRIKTEVREAYFDAHPGERPAA